MSKIRFMERARVVGWEAGVAPGGVTSKPGLRRSSWVFGEGETNEVVLIPTT